MTDLGLHGLSCPYEPLDDELLDVLGAEYSRQHLRIFVERAAETLDTAGEGLSAAVEAGADGEVGFDVLWDASISELSPPTLAGSAAERVRRAAGVALRLTECGVARSWSAHLVEPAPLRLGRWTLADATDVEVGSNGSTWMHARLASGTKVRAVDAVDGWEVCGAIERPAVVMRRFSATLLAEDRLATSAELRRAVELLRDHAPEYLGWIDRVIRHVAPIPARPGTMRSASFPGRAGVVEMSFGCSVGAIAEMLVHEASHQHFHLASRLDDVDDGSDRTLYYSPLKDTGRPIDAILLAYHAFGNVLLLYRRCLEAGADPDGYFERNISPTSRQLAQLDDALRTTTALTDVGTSLCRPLSERLVR